MLRMDQYEHVRTAYRVYDQSISEISRTTGHSRNTIRKALNNEYCRYPARKKQAYPVLGAFTDIIDSWLRDDRQQPVKQRHTAKRIFYRLVAEHDFTGSASNVRKYVREAKQRLGVAKDKAFIPLIPELGQEAEVDWGTAKVIIGEEPVQCKFLCMRSKGSAKPFVRIYPCERQQALFDALMHAFEFYGGVFPRLIFDNMTTAVRKVLPGKGRLEQESFSKFRAYYNFEARYCNPAAGHEKGGVEGLVGFSRRNFLVPVPKADSLEQINEHLLRQCVAYGQHTVSGQELSVNELFAKERSSLLKLPKVPFANQQILTGKVDKYATVIVDKNRYSVPTRLVGRSLRVICHFDKLEFFERGSRVATHHREYSNNKWQLDPAHYLELIKQRPLAFHDARPLHEWKKRWTNEMNQLLEHFCQSFGESRGIKEFISVLLLFGEHPDHQVKAAIAQGVAAGVSCAAAIQHLLGQCLETPEIMPLERYASLPDADISVYAALEGGIL